MMCVSMCAFTLSMDPPNTRTPPHLSFLFFSPRFLAAGDVTICNDRSGTNTGKLVCPPWVPGATFGYVITAVTQAYYGECSGQCGAWTDDGCWIDVSSTVTPACSDSAQCTVNVNSSWGSPCEGSNNGDYFCLSAVCTPVPPGERTLFER